MKRLKQILVAAIVTVALLSPVSLMHANAAPLDPCSVNPGSSVCHYQNTRGDYRQIVKNIVNILLYIVGASAVIMIIISGLKYVASAGNPSSVASAKNTLLYSVIGLAVAMVAYVIVNWVIFSVSR